jgi:hypothetical protein
MNTDGLTEALCKTVYLCKKYDCIIRPACELKTPTHELHCISLIGYKFILIRYTLMIEAVSSSETSVSIYQTTRCNISIAAIFLHDPNISLSTSSRRLCNKSVSFMSCARNSVCIIFHFKVDYLFKPCPI